MSDVLGKLIYTKKKPISFVFHLVRPSGPLGSLRIEGPQEKNNTMYWVGGKD
jgi:hypothetical protein